MLLLRGAQEGVGSLSHSRQKVSRRGRRHTGKRAKDIPGIIIKATGGAFLIGCLKGVAISDIVRLSLMGHEVAKMTQHVGPKHQRPAG